MVKNLKKINIKGFTLIELLAVVVIIGLVLIVAIPSVSKLIHNNKQQEYENYYKVIEEAAIVFAGKLSSKLGGSMDTGCVYEIDETTHQKITLEVLKERGYLKNYDEITSSCQLNEENNNGIVIRNDKGKITANFQLKCDSGITLGTKETKDMATTCVTNIIESGVNLMTQISETITETVKVDEEMYLNGVSPNNYIWYSGKLWRIVSYNTITETVKAVTVDSMSTLYYNKEETINNYKDSDIEFWLNNTFFNSLKDPQTFLSSESWNYGMGVRKAKVGLITSSEYESIKKWYLDDNQGSTWLLDVAGTVNKYVDSTGGVKDANKPNYLYAVRPVVSFSSDVMVIKGEGTDTNPYIIDNSSNATGKKNELINTRYSGEYIELDGKKYRIVSVNNGVTKVISTYSVGSKAIDDSESDEDYDYATSTLREELEKSDGTFKKVLPYITNGDFCLEEINGTTPTVPLSNKCIDLSKINSGIKIGLPKFGDLFTSNINGVSNYWTINPNTITKDADNNITNQLINVITGSGIVETISPTDTSIGTVVVFYLNSNVKINGGEGTASAPYELTN